jgi:hypothetical protein
VNRLRGLKYSPNFERVSQLLSVSMLVIILTACSGPAASFTPTRPSTALAEAVTGDFQPLASCQDYLDDLAKILNREVVSANKVPFHDYVSGKSGVSCQLTVSGTGVEIESPWVVADAVTEMLAGQGWQTDIRYQADGPTGTGVGFRKDNSLCLLSVNWQPSPDVDCPADWPLSACNLTPEQQLYELTLNCAQGVSSLPVSVAAVPPEAAEAEQYGAQLLKLTLRPAKEGYDLEEARLGNVTLIAGLENSGNTPLILAHPNVCFPHDYQAGESFQLTEREGKSEISILITRPNETQISLRHNLLRMFEPGHKDHLVIQPGEAKEIQFGWFAPASLGQWDYDSGGAITEPIFSQKGTYHLGVKFTNMFPRAHIYDEAESSHMIDTAWTGEVQSSTIIVIQ